MSSTKNPTPNVDIDLDEIIAQKADARGDDGRTVTFRFKGDTWTFLDPQTLTDDEKEELQDIDFDVDVAAWYMGDDQYDRFVAAGGSSSIFFQAFRAHQKKITEELAGRPTRPNRSSRRARKR